jgi:hypothetical protein
VVWVYVYIYMDARKKGGCGELESKEEVCKEGGRKKGRKEGKVVCTTKMTARREMRGKEGRKEGRKKDEWKYATHKVLKQFIFFLFHPLSYLSRRQPSFLHTVLPSHSPSLLHTNPLSFIHSFPSSPPSFIYSFLPFLLHMALHIILTSCISLPISVEGHPPEGDQDRIKSVEPDGYFSPI